MYVCNGKTCIRDKSKNEEVDINTVLKNLSLHKNISISYNVNFSIKSVDVEYHKSYCILETLNKINLCLIDTTMIKIFHIYITNRNYIFAFINVKMCFFAQ